MGHDVFVSHSSRDKVTADAVCAALEAEGIRCWVAPRDILPGRDWGASIVEAIRGARVMVLIFSANANQSPQISREVERAVNRGVPIIPLRIEDVPPTESLEYFISTPHWLDAFTPPLERHLQYLVQVVRRILDTPPPAPAIVSLPQAARRQVEQEAPRVAEQDRSAAEAIETAGRAKAERDATATEPVPPGLTSVVARDAADAGGEEVLPARRRTIQRVAAIILLAIVTFLFWWFGFFAQPYENEVQSYRILGIGTLALLAFSIWWFDRAEIRRKSGCSRSAQQKKPSDKPPQAG